MRLEMTAPDCDVVIVGAGILGIYQLYVAREAGYSVRLRELYQRIPVLRAVVAGVGLVGGIRRAAGDRAVPELRGGQVRLAAAHPVRRHGDVRRVGRGP